MPLFEVEIQNRVVKGKFGEKRIKGQQGDWYLEKLYYLAESEEEAKEFAIEKIKKRRILGVPFNTKRKLIREVQIIEVSRIA